MFWSHKLRLNPDLRHVSESTSLNFLLFCALFTLFAIFRQTRLTTLLSFLLKQGLTQSADSHVLCKKRAKRKGQPAPRETGGRRRGFGRQSPRKRRRDLRSDFKVVCLIEFLFSLDDFFPKCSVRISAYNERHPP